MNPKRLQFMAEFIYFCGCMSLLFIIRQPFKKSQISAYLQYLQDWVPVECIGIDFSIHGSPTFILASNLWDHPHTGYNISKYTEISSLFIWCLYSSVPKVKSPHYHYSHRLGAHTEKFTPSPQGRVMGFAPHFSFIYLLVRFRHQLFDKIFPQAAVNFQGYGSEMPSVLLKPSYFTINLYLNACFLSDKACKNHLSSTLHKVFVRIFVNLLLCAGIRVWRQPFPPYVNRESSLVLCIQNKWFHCAAQSIKSYKFYRG